MAVTDWTPATWRALPARQQPVWPDRAALEDVRLRLRQLPPLVFAGEARALQRALGEAAEGRAFLLQAGDCAESFRDVSAIAIRERLKVLLQMSAVLTYGATLPVVKVGRIAGQFAKPRSSDTELVGGVELPSFRGHAVHSDEPTPEARRPDPERLLQAYYQGVSTLNLLRAFTKGGFADLTQVHTWNQEFVASSLEGRRYETIANEIGRALRFMQAIGIDLGDERSVHEVDVWTSHEALLLDYEEPLVRQDSTTGDWYACSAHFLWVGERTRGLDGAHVAFLEGVHNPVGAKIGPAATPEEVVALAERLNPDRIPGRLTLIARLGADHVEELLPPLLAAVRESGVVGQRPDAREHLRHGRRPQDPPLRRRDAGDRGLLRRPPQRRDVARRRSSRDHGGERDRVPGRRRGGQRGAARPSLRDALRPAPQRAPVARSRVQGRRAHARLLTPCGRREPGVGSR
jgi:3-deoxy-7-phosphoheptulonate synthase